MSAGLDRLREALRAEGGLLAATVAADTAAPDGRPDHAAAAAAGPRVAGHRDAIELAVAAVREGYELHYARPRALRMDDPDLALLAGDRLYALGLAHLAAAGDLVAIAELADIIARSAQAHAEGRVERAEAAWKAGCAAIAGDGAGAAAERS